MLTDDGLPMTDRLTTASTGRAVSVPLICEKHSAPVMPLLDGDELQIVERGIRAEGRAEGFTGGMWLGIIT